MQYGYKDWIPSQSYYAFATRVGCPPSLPYGQHPQTIFECLLGIDEATWQMRAQRPLNRALMVPG